MLSQAPEFVPTPKSIKVRILSPLTHGCHAHQHNRHAHQCSRNILLFNQHIGSQVETCQVGPMARRSRARIHTVINRGFAEFFASSALIASDSTPTNKTWRLAYPLLIRLYASLSWHSTNLGLEIQRFQGRAQQWSAVVHPQPGARPAALTDPYALAHSLSCNAV